LAVEPARNTTLQLVEPHRHPVSRLPARRWADADDRLMIARTIAGLELISGKWKVDILFLLAGGVRRHAHVLDHLIVSKKVLTATLRELERDGLVERNVISERPRHVEYALTPLGRSMTAPLLALCEWVEEHEDAVAAARERHPRMGEMPRFSAGFEIRR
jgi:DNA-binding HxlR family transcriptional regulator